MWGRDAKCSFKPHNQSPAESDGQQRILRLDWNRQRQAAVNEDREREITTTKRSPEKVNLTDCSRAEQSEKWSIPRSIIPVNKICFKTCLAKIKENCTEHPRMAGSRFRTNVQSSSIQHFVNVCFLNCLSSLVDLFIKY